MADRTVLVVDDDPDILSIVEQILSFEGYNVLTATNGLEALDLVEQVRPELILLDMRMPVMDGWQFVGRLRAYRDSPVPLLVMTAATDARRRAREVGADGYIAKPFDIEDLLEKVRQHVDAYA